MANSIPSGFNQHFKSSAFTDPWEPLMSRILDNQVQIGVVLRPAHCNSRGLVHGAFLAAIADNALGLSIATELSNQDLEVGSLVTSNLTIDYIGMAKVGDWIATNTQVLKVGRNQCIANCLIESEDHLIARANATFLNRIKR
ncbi:MAG: PaaI family thioesterase [Pseudomonadota bacterium]